MSPVVSDRVLPLGSFYGTADPARVVGGFRLTRLFADPHRSVQLHTHETAHFVLPLRGPYLSSAHQAPPICDRQVVIYNPPNTTHRDRFDRIGDRIEGQFFTVSVAAERMEEIRSVAPLTDRAVALCSPAATGLVRRLLQESQVGTPASDLAVEGLCLELMAEVAHRSAGDRQAPAWLTAAERLISERCTEKMTIGEIAAQVGVHPVHLARGFRRWRQTSPAEVLRRARLTRAEGLLRSTTVPLAQIALQVGFGDQSHFTRAFTARYRISPGRLRAEFRAEAGRFGPGLLGG